MAVLWFDGLLTRLDDAGVYFLPESDLDELLEATAINRFSLLRVNLAGCHERQDLLLRLAGVLQRTANVARDFDDVADAVRALGRDEPAGLVLLLEHSEQLRAHAPDTLKQAMETLQAASLEWAARQTPLWTFIALPDREFDAIP